MTKTKFYNIRIDLLKTDEALARLESYFSAEQTHLVFFLNAHCFNIAQKNPDYMQALNNAHLLLNDGIGIKLGGMMSGIKIEDNLNGTDFIPKVIELAQLKNYNIYLLGGEKGIPLQAKEKILAQYPNAQIVGSRNGYFEFDNDELIVQDIIQKKTDLLLVGMGVPRQELWLMKNRDKLKGVHVCIAGGAILDFIAEKVSRAPLFMRKTGTEWIFRIYQEPKRLFNRYFIGIPVYFKHLIRLKRT
jgi:exopolysaccharide biosynthesis WecB/TagA/CpsF family protein